MSLYRVIVSMEGRNPKHTDYPLLPGDIISPTAYGWMKHAPGLGVFGFVLSDDDLSGNCEPADDARWVIQ